MRRRVDIEAPLVAVREKADAYRFARNPLAGSLFEQSWWASYWMRDAGRIEVRRQVGLFAAVEPYAAAAAPGE